MDIVIRTGFQAISHSISFNPQGIIKGKMLAVCHICRVEELRSNDAPTLIRCSVVRQRSVTLPPYKVQLHVNQDRHVTDVSCTCVSAAGKKCKHIFALIHYINTDRSATKTSVEQEWGKPSDRQLGKDIYSKAMIVTDHYPIPAAQQVTRRVETYKITYEDVEPQASPLKSLLRELNRTTSATVARSILRLCIDDAIRVSNDNNCEACALNLIIFSQEGPLYSSNLNENLDEELSLFYMQTIALSESKVVELCVLTERQTDCEEWFSARKFRISASAKAHAIKTRTRKGVDSLLNDFFSKSHFQGAAVEYGSKHEKIAALQYEKEYKVQIVHIGLFILQSQPWLCASLDGIVIDHGCIVRALEIKCPWSCAKKSVYDESTGNFNVPYLYLENGNIELKKSHQYYTQCQIQMYVTGLTVCDLYVWSRAGSCVAIIHRDEAFLKSLVPILERFYFTYYLKAAFDKNEENVDTR